MPNRPRPQTSDEVRQAFVDFFASKGHLEQPSSSLVPPSNDPTVLLTTAGMQQMIPYMLGRAAPPTPRMTSVQKCFRTTDIDEVGNPRNLTFFEMLGNFSIGDYFKPGAIAWAWEFVTQWLQLPQEKVWITVHPTDEEAVPLWLEQGVPKERIVALDDNWWGPPGAEGPCGPDSELYYDRGPAFGCGRPECAPGCDCDRYLEFWNLVFMQFFQDQSGERTPLPRPNIDTGMGLERVTALLQDVPTVYETDLFRPIIDHVARQVGTGFGRDEKTDFALRVLADHGRGMTFLAGDGVTPGPEGRGYVMRRVIRRAIRYGRQLGLDRPFVGEVADRVIERMAGRYRELAAQRDTIISILEVEERAFRQTLTAGEARIDELVAATKGRGETQVAGRQIFDLYQTYGVPPELVEETLAEHGLRLDWPGFEAARDEHARVSRAGAVSAQKISTGGLDASLPRTQFLGYELLTSPAELLALQGDEGNVRELPEGARGAVVLDRTPFYAEGGGQVGDRGVLRLPEGLFEVDDTQDDGAGRFLHRGRVVSGVLRPGSIVEAEVDRARRGETTRHHTLTHLLHQSLRNVLGPATHQRGSLVAPGVARFDFNYSAPLSDLQRREVQDLINQHVLDDLEVEWRVMSLDEARETGAMMIFGEKYGERVRVVEIGEFSKELCGGTHVHHSAEVGTAVILRETGIGAGLRRVEVVAGQAGLDHLYRQLEDLQQIARRFNVPLEQARRKVDELLGQLDEARREIQRLSNQLAARQAGELSGRIQEVEGIKVLATRVEQGNQRTLTEQWDALRDQLTSGVVFLAAADGGRTALVVGVTNDLQARGLNAGNLMRKFAPLAGGSGGGSPTLAKGGGTDPALLGPALEAAPALVREALQGAR